MKIAIDTHFITSGRATGNRTYTAELVKAMISLDTPHEFILYAVGDHPYYSQFNGNPRVEVREVLSRSGFVRNFISIPHAVAIDRPDILHLLFILPPFLRVPTVLTVHDLFYIHDKNVGAYNRAIGKLTEWSIPRAEKVITISEYSRQDILASCRIDPAQVVPIPLGIDKRFVPAEDQGGVREKLGITRSYILYVGRTEDPRKNLSTLIDAYAALRKEMAMEEQLVIAGRHGPGTELLFKKCAEHGLEDDILFPGIIHEKDLAPLLSGASLFVYASSFEGFGLPVIEAMACGAPVITSPVTSLPEVAGDAALMVTPGNVHELVQALKRALGDKSLRESLRLKGMERAKLFDWESVARSTLRVYEDIASKGRS